jgi:hypothetical protein
LGCFGFALGGYILQTAADVAGMAGGARAEPAQRSDVTHFVSLSTPFGPTAMA